MIGASSLGSKAPAPAAERMRNSRRPDDSGRRALGMACRAAASGYFLTGAAVALEVS